MTPRLSVGSDGGSSALSALLAIVVGLAVLGYGGYDYAQQSDAVSNAVEVNATITEKGLDSVSKRRGGTDYRPTVTFEYRYEGTNYTGTDVYPASTTSDFDAKSAARSDVAAYEVGEPVTAYVDPSSPSEGFLRAQESSAPLKLLGIGALFALLGIASLFRS